MTKPWIIQRILIPGVSRKVGIIEKAAVMQSNIARMYTSLKANICNEANLLYMMMIKVHPRRLATDTTTTVE